MADDNLDVLLRTTDNTTMSLEQSKNSIILKGRSMEFVRHCP